MYAYFRVLPLYQALGTDASTGSTRKRDPVVLLYISMCVCVHSKLSVCIYSVLPLSQVLGTVATTASSKKDPPVFSLASICVCLYLSICTHSVPPPFTGGTHRRRATFDRCLKRGEVLRVVVCGVVLVVCCVVLFLSCVCVCGLFLFLEVLGTDATAASSKKDPAVFALVSVYVCVSIYLYTICVCIYLSI